MNRILFNILLIFFASSVFFTTHAFATMESWEWNDKTQYDADNLIITDSGQIILKEAGTIEDPNKRLEYLIDQCWNLRNHLPDQSIQLGLRAIGLADSLGDYYNLAKAHGFTGVSYRLLGDYNKAIELFFKGLALSKKHEIPQQEGFAYINIANLYIYLEFYTQALESLAPALEIATNINDNEMLSYIFLNKGRVLLHLDSINPAIENIRLALQIRIESGNTPGQAVCYKYLGDIYFNLHDFQSARENYEMALATVNKQEDMDLLGNIKLKQAQIYCQTEKFSEAFPLAKSALSTGQELNSRLLIHDALKILSRVDMQFGRFESAATRLVEMNQYADTLFNQQLSEKVLSMEFQMERQKQQAELDIITRDKEIQSLKISRQRFLNIGLIVFTLLLFITGSILLILLNKLKQKNLLLSQQKEDLKLINAAKDRMFMVIGHDLRGPVWNLRALIELLKEDSSEFDNPVLHENFNALSRAVQSVSDLLENLLYWAKSQDGKIIFKPGPINMKAIILKSIHPYTAWAETKNIQIDFVTDDSTAMVYADENMIQTVVRNLLSNAIKYSFKDGRIELSTRQHGTYCRFSIRDYGIGINPDAIDHIFTNDIIASAKGTGNEMGSGIGLGLCNDFIAKHNAELKVESTPGKGTLFFFDLPLPQS